MHRQAGFKDSDHLQSESKELFGEDAELLYQFVMPRAKEANCWGGDKEEISDDCKKPISAEKKYESENGLDFGSDLQLTSFITNRAILETLKQAEKKIEEFKATSIRMAELTCANTMR